MTTTEETRSQPASMAPWVIGLFFVWGLATVLVDTLVPKLKALFELSYAEAMLTQFSFFLAYFLVSIPAGALLAKVGYVRGILIGLSVMATGCLMFVPATYSSVFASFLVALFVMASGITMLQVAANPLMARLGSPESSHSRLNLAQAFNSLGTFLGPFLGAAWILKEDVSLPQDVSQLTPDLLATYRRMEAHVLQGPFVFIAAGLILLVILFWRFRKYDAPPAAEPTLRSQTMRLLTRPRLGLGVLSIFAYVGAEVSIGSLLINYLMQPSTLGVSAARAGQLLSLYWGGAMVGRFIGAAVLRRLSPGAVLCGCALTAAALACASSLTVGVVAASSVLAIGLCNSIMFPTIFTLAIEGLGDDTPRGSSLLCLAIVGGAVIPLIAGYTADEAGLGAALYVPAICYLWIATYGLLSRGSLHVQNTCR